MPGIGPSRRFVTYAGMAAIGSRADDRTNAEGSATDANDPMRTSDRFARMRTVVQRIGDAHVTCWPGRGSIEGTSRERTLRRAQGR